MLSTAVPFYSPMLCELRGEGGPNRNSNATLTSAYRYPYCSSRARSRSGESDSVRPAPKELLNFAHQQEDRDERVDRQSFDQAGADDHGRLNLARRFRLAADCFHGLADGALKSDAGTDGREAETDGECQAQCG